MPRELTDELREEYERLFNTMSVQPERRSQIERIRKRVNHPRARDRYIEVERATNVPWFVIAIIHNLESSVRFDRHLHNGDPLTARTYRVPKGRPREGNPPFSWPESAIDALRVDDLDRWSDWSLPGIAFVLERYNGWGYRKYHPSVKSPYLWSFSSAYTRGKYTSDGSFSKSAVSRQCGGMVLLHALMDADQSIRQRVAFEPPDDNDEPPFPRDPDDRNGGDEDREPPPAYPGRYLQNGIENDRYVRMVQERLKELGADPGAIDGDFGDVTEFAVKLFQARSSNFGGEPLEIDGVVGPETWAALFGAEPEPEETTPPPPAGSLAEQVIEVADLEVGVREQPLGSNRGPEVDQYVSSVGLNPSGRYPWCMCFVYWCYREAAEALRTENRVPRTGGVHNCWRKSKRLDAPVRVVTSDEARRNPALVQPGMVFFIDTGGGRGHTGIVAANINGKLETIEGNTTAATGSREGIGVFRRTRRRISDRNMMGFASYG